MLRTDQESLLERDWFGLPLLAWALLVLTTILSLVWSHAHLLWIDEFLAYYTDSLPTFGDVMRVQLHYPIVIDPPVQHIMVHAFMDVFGVGILALRLPSLIGFLLFQLCIYLFCSRMAGKRAGVIGMLVPLFTCTVFHSVNGRPYALLMGLFMLSLVFWQRAVRSGEVGASRTLALVGLWLALALAISTQFFGVLVLVPVWIGELARTISRRRIDKPVLGTLVLGVGSVVLILPFLSATRIYRVHYIAGDMSMRYVVEIYRSILQDGPFQLAHRFQMTLIGAFVLVLVIGAAVRLRKHLDTPYEWAAVAALALIPVFGHELEVYVTHTLMARYVLPGVGGFAVAAGLVFAGPVRRNAVFYGSLLVLLVLGVGLSVRDIQLERVRSAEILASCEETPAVKSELDSRPTDKLYFQTLSQYFTASYYEPDPQRRLRMVLLTDQEELQWQGVDNFFILTQNLQRFSSLPIVTYDQFLTLKDPLIVYYVDQSDGDNWIDRDLKARGYDVKPIGPWLNGTLAATHGR
jgi:uncharacterized membrane protein